MSHFLPMHNQHTPTHSFRCTKFHFNELSNVLNLKLEKFCRVFPFIEIIRFNSIYVSNGEYENHLLLVTWANVWLRFSVIFLSFSHSSYSCFSFCFSLIGFGWFMSFHFTLFQLNRQIQLFCYTNNFAFFVRFIRCRGEHRNRTDPPSANKSNQMTQKLI